jgi:membrane protein DedA with SNARE-associated domain
MTQTQWLQTAIEQYGYIVVFFAVGIESMGVPFPGETALIAGAVFAATSGHFSIVGVIAAAAAGAILGDNLGYAIGSRRGYQLLRRFSGRLHLNERHLANARSFFARHGDKTVFFGRFFAILRTWAAFLAGVNHMPRRSFFFWNALGGITWSIFYGTLGYLLGNNLPLLSRIQHIMGLWGTALVIVALLLVWLCWFLWRRGYLRYSWMDATWARLGAWLIHPGAATEDSASLDDTDGTDGTDGAADRSPRRRARRRRHGILRPKRNAAPANAAPPIAETARSPFIQIDPAPNRPTNGSPTVSEHASGPTARPTARPTGGQPGGQPAGQAEEPEAQQAQPSADPRQS